MAKQTYQFRKINKMEKYKLLFLIFLILVTTTYQLWQQYFSIEVRIVIGMGITIVLMVMYIQLLIRFNKMPHSKSYE